MRLYHRLRPRLYADAIQGAVSSAFSKGRILDVGAEAKRIANATGLSPIVAARDLVEVGLGARINMEFSHCQLLMENREAVG
ncbi:hypothetical protein SAMN05519104_7837 [Rhizobiales bacterium GAS188]|nr:hypothetical protein SAMN05519104_7837 [Rhizobiales bacterium GAS188]